MVVNRVPTEEAAQSAWKRFSDASQRFLGHRPELVGWVPADAAVGRSVEARHPVSLLEPESDAARAMLSVSRWGPIDHARSASPFFERARSALR